MQTTNPILTPGEREIIHELDSSRALIMRRLATRDDFWRAEWRFVPGGPVPQPIQFGRAQDREPIQDAPAPSHPPLWRLGIALVALVPLAAHDAVVWFAERIRSIVRALA